jgi:hypothetical protein
MKTIILSLSILTAITTGCKSKQKTSETASEQTKEVIQEEELVKESAPPEDYFYEKDGFVKAVVMDYSKLDGCTWMIKTLDNELLRPMTLDSSFYRNKMAVWIKYRPTKPMVSVCMTGKSVNILAIEPRN